MANAAYIQNICTLLKPAETPTRKATQSVRLVIVILTPDFLRVKAILSEVGKFGSE